MRTLTTRIALSLALIGLQLGCTKAVTLNDVDYATLDGSGDKRYRIEMKTGEVHVVKEFRSSRDGILVTRFDRYTGNYDPDQMPVPTAPFFIPTAEVAQVDEIRADGGGTARAIVIIAGTAVLLFVMVGAVMSSTVLP